MLNLPLENYCTFVYALTQTHTYSSSLSSGWSIGAREQILSDFEFAPMATNCPAGSNATARTACVSLIIPTRVYLGN